MQISHVRQTEERRNVEVILKMTSKRKLNHSVSLTHFGFTSKKVALRDEEAPKEDGGAASTVGPLPTRTEDPFPPSDSPEEQREVEAECSEDAAGAEVTLAASTTAASTSDLQAAWSTWTTKQVGEWKDRNPWLDIKAGKLGCLVCRKAKTLLLPTNYQCFDGHEDDWWGEINQKG